ncbi:prolyl oligopeptidase family serine peptidase [Longimicrobium terrae]|uniref:Dipeptidyl aminopeptidase/acylaminoacyl peptidase n=1 Tax=Longimicrobium terrae TaxID=1639882 RepID=A0A841H168_9BACT|nr:prolyl oligopeptidase family serine peptidase [Longimicrobium terrae]MBB4637423.1 dipeptidyl aminopeptidase/acylaminoacyl peptidase [Longimicrobium terrae]MBB6071821.1 dipeptidyl aminopeptidase/acylaminoacyl peptidase [Longimicrobium terrae]NNC30371.1 S9 family peptidase [Longimicrobium terrae]
MTRSPLRGAACGAVLLAAAWASPAGAQTAANGYDLSVRNIMRGPELVGRSPDEVRWSDDGRWVYFRWRNPEARDTATHVYRVAAAGGEPQMLADSVADRVAPAMAGAWNRDRTRRAAERMGDVYVTVDGRERRITDTPTRERQPELSRDGRTVFFVSGTNLWSVPVEGGPLRQLTDIRSEAAPRPPETAGQRGALRQDQTELFDVIRDRDEERRRREQVDSLRATVRPAYIGRNMSVSSFEVSPSGRYLLLGVSERVEGAQQTSIPYWITESGYTEPVNQRNKVGDVQSVERAAILDLNTSRLAWITPDSAQTARKVSLTTLAWAPSQDRALVMGVPYDFKARWLYVAGTDGKLTMVDEVRDTAWVGGPGLYTADWISDDRIFFVSEASGYAHLYTRDLNGGAATPVTSGQWEVTDVTLTPDRRTFLITTSETHPGERALYSVPVTGGARTRITPLAGWTEATPSPDTRWLALLHSTSNTPPELYLMPNRPGARPRQVTESRTAEFRRGSWIQPEVMSFRARDGQMVYARIYRPRDVGAQPNGGGVFFVHGAGYLQDAHRGWSTYYREYMFNHLLASRGYTVMDVDYRGSSGYGAAVRTGIYRHMGGLDLTDHVDAARWMVQNEGVDPKRIGLYGGSYGGFITLMGMFTEQETFRSGAALRSVTDWSHYNHWYTSRILNLPQTDTLAYRQSSPIYFAEGLRGDLLMAHGMVDTNVHFQDIVRLSQRLIELGKTNWELAVYPVEDHGFVRADSWTDEYRRIYELFERTLRPESPPLPNGNGRE